MIFHIYKFNNNISYWDLNMINFIIVFEGRLMRVRIWIKDITGRENLEQKIKMFDKHSYR